MFDPFSPHATRAAPKRDASERTGGMGRTHPTQTLSSSLSKSIPRSIPNRRAALLPSMYFPG
eukprot:7380484-Prymnesium_polylepis.2